ncbi:MAG: hypothetical protein IJW92_07070 [Clostridia bacterium]|nr:hypothetical protein [Clostridia bacterium]
MEAFFDLHSHMLSGVDDGAKNREMMFSMLEMAYADGIRAVCLTPHYSPYLFGDTHQTSEAAFAVLCDYVAQKHPDMKLFLGHELGYHQGCLRALEEGSCRTVAGSRYVLVDFPEKIDFFEIKHAMNSLRSGGYSPILAHTERYRCLFSKFDWVREFVEDGGIVQINASSVCGSWGTMAKMQWKRLVRAGLVHVVSTDAHNTTTRPPKMTVCMDYLKKHCDPDTVRALVWEHAWRIVEDKPID